MRRIHHPLLLLCRHRRRCRLPLLLPPVTIYQGVWDGRRKYGPITGNTLIPREEEVIIHIIHIIHLHDYDCD